MRRPWTSNHTAAGAKVVLSDERRFRRIVLRVALAALSVLVVVGTVFSIRARRSLCGQVERMELEISRSLDALRRAGDDISTPIDTLDATATRWREKLRVWKNVPDDETQKLLRLQKLQDKVIPSWREKLADTSFDASHRRETILFEVLREQSSWPPPPPPPIVWEFSSGVKEFCNGALEGVVWPWLVGSRSIQLHRISFRSSFAAGARFILFPHRAPHLSFGSIFGFAVFVVAAGYFFCYVGMKANATFFSLLGLLYFLYAIIYAMFIGFLLTHLID